MTFLTPLSIKVLIFSLAKRLNTSSLPVLRMLSPQQFSWEPKIPKSTPAFLRILAVAVATFFILGS